jgi:hypothetical protein
LIPLNKIALDQHADQGGVAADPLQEDILPDGLLGLEPLAGVVRD